MIRQPKSPPAPPEVRLFFADWDSLLEVGRRLARAVADPPDIASDPPPAYASGRVVDRRRETAAEPETLTVLVEPVAVRVDNLGDDQSCRPCVTLDLTEEQAVRLRLEIDDALDELRRRVP